MSIGYLAARYSRRAELCLYRSQLEERGHNIGARWLNGNHQVEGLTAQNADTIVIPNERAVGFAIDDAEDITASDFLIAFTEEPRSGATRGGRHWELGFASGIRHQRWPFSTAPRIHIVGPLEHVFTSLPLFEPPTAHEFALIDGRFPDWDAFLAALDDGKVKL